MKKLLAILALCLFLCGGGLALAVPRYLVEDSSDVIKAYTEDDSLVAPAGHTAVNASVIEAAYTGTIYQGGTWDGTTYTPPTGIVTEIDGTTNIGSVQVAAHDMLDVFEQALGFIEVNRYVWSQAHYCKGHRGNPLDDN